MNSILDGFVAFFVLMGFIALFYVGLQVGKVIYEELHRRSLERAWDAFVNKKVKPRDDHHA